MLMPLAETRVLVTGATGFIGRALCGALADAGARVDALSRGGQRPEGAERAFACDVSDPKSVAQAVDASRPALVYHLAAHVTGSRAIEAVWPTFASKLGGAVALLLATQALPDCRVVLAGSLEESAPDDPDAPPVSPYAAASDAMRRYGALFHALHDREVVHARIGMVYGPGDPSAARLVPYVVRSLLAGRAPELASGRRRVDWIYVDDLVRGLIALGRTRAIVSGSVDLGSGELVSIREIAERLARAIGGDTPLRFGARPDPAGEREFRAELAATRARLDWRPEVGLDEGLRRTIEAERGSSVA